MLYAPVFFLERTQTSNYLYKDQWLHGWFCAHAKIHNEHRKLLTFD